MADENELFFTVTALWTAASKLTSGHKNVKKKGICTSKVNSSIFGSPVVPNNTRKWIIRICMWVIQATGQLGGWAWHCTHDSASETRTAVRASSGTAQTLNWPIVLHDSRHTLVALQWHCTEDVSVETATLINVSNESQASTVQCTQGWNCVALLIVFTMCETIFMLMVQVLWI